VFDVDVVDHACDDGAAARVAFPPIAPRIEPQRRQRRARRRYSPRLPRTAIGALAMAMTALTMIALVMLPAALESATHALY
jgi:hypothetical protein